MVRRKHILVTSLTATVLLVMAVVYLWKLDVPEKGGDRRGHETDEVFHAVPVMSMSEEEASECFSAFAEICSAYSNLQFEVMQDVFSVVSNKLSRCGKERIKDIVAPVDKYFHDGSWHRDAKMPEFSTVSEFDRYMRTNITAAKILGYSMAANDVCDNAAFSYDMAIFNGIDCCRRKFADNDEQTLALSVKAFLDDWKEYLASGQSTTRMLFRQQLKSFLKMPRREAEDMGMESNDDWIAYFRETVLKFHEQCYGVTPKWLDEDFPIPPNRTGDNGKSRELRK